MNYYGAKDLANSLLTVRKNTIMVAEDIAEKEYGFRATPEVRTVGQMFAHIALGTRFQKHIHGERLTTMEGFDFKSYFDRQREEEQAPRTKEQVVTLLREEGDHFANWVESLSDEFLGERVSFPAAMPNPSRTRFEMLLAAKEHEMHHRAQLMLIERLLGVVPHLTRDMQARMAAMSAAGTTIAAGASPRR